MKRNNTYLEHQKKSHRCKFSSHNMGSNNLWDIMYESRNMIKPHRCHFLTLSIIFLLPSSSSFLLLPSLSYFFNHYFTNPLFQLLYSLFVSLFSYCGVITITYSVFHFFYNQPVNLTSAIKSISTSFLPLLATTIVSQVIIFFISLFYGFLLVLLILVAEIFHVSVPYSAPYFIGFFVALPLVIVMVYLQVNWTLVPVIVVVESYWGLEALRRSTRLIKGMKRVALSALFFFGSFAVMFVFNCLILTTGGNNEKWVSVVLRWVIIVGDSYLIAMVMLGNLAVNTVLYIYCKANHDGEIAEEFGKVDYVSLPFHDGNVSHV